MHVWWVLFDMARKTLLMPVVKTLFNMGLKVNGKLNITITQYYKELKKKKKIARS